MEHAAFLSKYVYVLGIQPETQCCTISIISLSQLAAPCSEILQSQKYSGCKQLSIHSCYKTSCSSTTYTRDKISLAFGDSYGNEVYIKRLDDPSSGTFERCSTDTFQINGPCVYDICYLYMLRTGYDGWKPESVKIYAPYTKTVKFNYNKFLPNGVWFGFNVCFVHLCQLPLCNDNMIIIMMRIVVVFC
ncbi:embryo-specific protein [Salix suchowensis]|nr:embryo-specific protein [Salix suchowensis]